MHKTKTLADLEQGATAIVSNLSSIGPIRRRLLDIGLLPGTKVECVQKSPLGDPVAFMVKGAVIALRYEDYTCVSIRV